ncbi:hypothetical protein BOW44_00110 [Solemya velum gill symbiont]|nr:hypothetical protein BOW44_00110 [Solemya velum gill symbiont]
MARFTFLSISPKVVTIAYGLLNHALPASASRAPKISEMALAWSGKLKPHMTSLMAEPLVADVMHTSA